MGDPFIGEIRAFGFGHAPKGWALADGALLPIKDHSTLFALYGVTFGGDGVKTFGLPDLRGRAIAGVGRGAGESLVRGQTGGVEFVTVNQVTMPGHTHPIRAYSRPGRTTSPNNAFPASVAPDPQPPQHALPRYGDLDAHRIVLAPVSPHIAGGGEPHTNLQPHLTINYCVALEGLYPLHQ